MCRTMARSFQTSTESSTTTPKRSNPGNTKLISFEAGKKLLKKLVSLLSGTSSRAITRLPKSWCFGSMLSMMAWAYVRTPFWEWNGSEKYCVNRKFIVFGEFGQNGLDLRAKNDCVFGQLVVSFELDEMTVSKSWKTATYLECRTREQRNSEDRRFVPSVCYPNQIQGQDGVPLANVFGLQDFLVLDVILAGLLNDRCLDASTASSHREKSLFDNLLNHYLK